MLPAFHRSTSAEVNAFRTAITIGHKHDRIFPLNLFRGHSLSHNVQHYLPKGLVFPLNLCRGRSLPNATRMKRIRYRHLRTTSVEVRAFRTRGPHPAQLRPGPPLNLCRGQSLPHTSRRSTFSYRNTGSAQPLSRSEPSARRAHITGESPPEPWTAQPLSRSEPYAQQPDARPSVVVNPLNLCRGQSLTQALSGVTEGPGYVRSTSVEVSTLRTCPERPDRAGLAPLNLCRGQALRANSAVRTGMSSAVNRSTSVEVSALRPPRGSDRTSAAPASAQPISRSASSRTALRASIVAGSAFRSTSVEVGGLRTRHQPHRSHRGSSAQPLSRSAACAPSRLPCMRSTHRRPLNLCRGRRLTHGRRVDDPPLSVRPLNLCRGQALTHPPSTLTRSLGKPTAQPLSRWGPGSPANGAGNASLGFIRSTYREVGGLRTAT